MAGDKKGEQRGFISREGNEAKGLNEQFKGSVLEPQLRQFRDFYMQAAPQQMGDYSSLMGQYQDFAKTGGYSQGDLANIRSRAVSPLRSVYANANREVDRSRALQGGYSPGFGALKARMAREQGQGIADASTNAEAAIAEMVQRGKLHGLAGGSSLYGTTPGMSSMFGNQVLNATGQLGNAYDNDLRLRLGLIGAHQASQQLPGKWEGTLGRIGDVAQLGTSILSPWMGGGSTGGGIPSFGSPPSGMTAPPTFRGY